MPKSRSTWRPFAAAVAAVTLMIGGVAAYAAETAETPRTINACYHKIEGQLRLIDSQAADWQKRCRHPEVPLSWNVQGIQGEIGAQGPQGETGARGPQGETGAQGPQGETGAQGPQGETGAQGPQGETGAQGPQGETGAPGPQGQTGAQGPQGQTGAQGPQGPAGAQGEQGPAGPAGADGVSGLAGQSCKKGAFVTGFAEDGTIVCSDVALPPACEPTTLKHTMSALKVNDFDQVWRGGTVTLGTPECNVTLRRPSGSIVVIGQLGDAWQITGRTGFATAVLTVDLPQCKSLLAIPNVTDNRPSCSSAFTGFPTFSPVSSASVSIAAS
jgi:hypothetical protein